MRWVQLVSLRRRRRFCEVCRSSPAFAPASFVPQVLSVFERELVVASRPPGDPTRSFSSGASRLTVQRLRRFNDFFLTSRPPREFERRTTRVSGYGVERDIKAQAHVPAAVVDTG